MNHEDFAVMIQKEIEDQQNKILAKENLEIQVDERIANAINESSFISSIKNWLILFIFKRKIASLNQKEN